MFNILFGHLFIFLQCFFVNLYFLLRVDSWTGWAYFPLRYQKAIFFSLKTLPDKIRMQGSVFGEADISRCFAYTEGRLFIRYLKLLWIVVCASWDSLFLCREELAIDFWNRVLRRLSIIWLKWRILFHVMARADSASKVEVLLHSMVADFFPLIMFVEKRMRLVLVDTLCLAHVWQRLFYMAIVLGTGSHALRANTSEVKLGSISNTFLIDLIFVSRLVDQILDGQLRLKLGHAWWQLESSIPTLSVVQTLKVRIIVLVVVSIWRRRLRWQVVVVVGFEPANLIPTLEGPLRICLFIWLRNGLAKQNRKVVITRASFIQVSTHGLKKFFWLRTIYHPLLFSWIQERAMRLS